MALDQKSKNFSTTHNISPYFHDNCVHAILHLLCATWFTKKLIFGAYKFEEKKYFQKMIFSLMILCQDAPMYQIQAH